jgi:hypothetical protein
VSTAAIRPTVSRPTCEYGRVGTIVGGAARATLDALNEKGEKEVTPMKIKVRKNSNYLGTLLG